MVEVITRLFNINFQCIGFLLPGCILYWWWNPETNERPGCLHCLFLPSFILFSLLTSASSLSTLSSASSCLFFLIWVLFYLLFIFICLHPRLLNYKKQMVSKRVRPSPALASTVSVSCLLGLADLHTVQKMPEGVSLDTPTCTYKHTHTHVVIH